MASIYRCDGSHKTARDLFLEVEELEERLGMLAGDVGRDRALIATIAGSIAAGLFAAGVTPDATDDEIRATLQTAAVLSVLQARAILAETERVLKENE